MVIERLDATYLDIRTLLALSWSDASGQIFSLSSDFVPGVLLLIV